MEVEREITHGEPIGEFDTIGSLFEGDYGLVTIAPDTSASDAIRMMLEKGFSQIPITDSDGQLLGVFSLWSVVKHIHNHPMVPIGDLPVQELAANAETVSVDDSLHRAIPRLYDHEALVVDSPHGAQAVVTAWDLLDYTAKISRPYMMLREIELALRRILEHCIPQHDFSECVANALAHKYTEIPLPKTIDEMTFDDYHLLATNKRNWSLFQGVLGGNRTLVGSKLVMAGQIRNDVFHFRATDISPIDIDNLESTREWLLRVSKTLSAKDQRDG